MASDGSNTVANERPRDRWLAFWLVLGNFVVGLIGCVVRRSYPGPGLLEFAFAGLLFGQTSLVGLWGGLGTQNWLVRLVGVLVALVYLSGLFGIGLDGPQVLAVIMGFPAGLATASLLGVCRYFGLRIASSGRAKPEWKAAQFSIRQLMGLTLVVACCIALAKWLVPPFNIDLFLLRLLFVSIPFVVLGLVSAWAILGTKHPRLGILAVLLIAPILGFGSETMLSGGRGELANWTTATMTEALVLIVSLYVIRQFGFRIRWQRRGKAAVVAEELHEVDECGTVEQ